MLGLFALIIITAIGLFTLRFFLTKNSAPAAGKTERAAISLIREYVTLTENTTMSPSDKLTKLNDIRDRMILFEQARKSSQIKSRKGNVTYLAMFNSKDRDNRREC